MCPFRVVDEINQGMDQVNERKVFTLLVEAACQAGTPQCFMFTPKLLPDLPYTADVMPMLIFNGAHIADVTQGFRGVVRCQPAPPMLPPCWCMPLRSPCCFPGTARCRAQGRVMCCA